MAHQLWAKVDSYIEDRLIPADPVLDALLAANQKAGLPAIDVSPAQGQLLAIMVQMSAATRILEVGTLGGYSTIYMARALSPDGQIVSLEYDPHHAKTARANLDSAGFADQAEIIVGAAAETLPQLEARGQKSFDFVFIDADKPNNPTYLEWALKLTRPGATIICDNVIRDGDVIDPDNADPNVNGARAAFDFIAQRPNLKATAIQTVGSKGYDGFIVLTKGTDG